MDEQRLARILASLGDRQVGRAALDHLSVAMARELDVTAVGFALVLGGQHRGTLGASDERAAQVEDLQFTMGEGPCIEATSSGGPVFEPDLSTSSRWPAFGPEAAALGFGAAFAVPLQVGAARFGAVDIYNVDAGPLDDGVMDDVGVVADVATTRVMGVQADIPAASMDELLDDLAEARAVVHQATGVISVQMDVTLDEALIALRARSYADSRPVAAVASDVVERRMRFDDRGGSRGS